MSKKPTRRPQRERFVYFIKNTGGAVKIGSSYSPRARLADLQSSHPDRLELLAVHPGSFELETKLHDHFSSERKHGEWFAMTEELERVIGDVRNRRYDLTAYVDAIKEAKKSITDFVSEDDRDEAAEIAAEIMDAFGGPEKLSKSLGQPLARVMDCRRWPMWFAVHIAKRNRKAGLIFAYRILQAGNRAAEACIAALDEQEEERRLIEKRCGLPSGIIDPVLRMHFQNDYEMELVDNATGKVITEDDLH